MEGQFTYRQLRDILNQMTEQQLDHKVVVVADSQYNVVECFDQLLDNEDGLDPSQMVFNIVPLTF